MARVATIDIGTNSVLLLIAERNGEGVTAVVERATITRLGEGVDRTRRLAAGACERTLDCLRAYATEISAHAVSKVVAVGTSAMRDAENGSDFRAAAKQILGVEPVVVSGEDEALLTFAGALSGLDLEGRVLVFDVGGGSTEIIVGTHGVDGHTIESAVSLNVGSVRLFERFLHSDPPATGECEKLREFVRQQLSRASVAPGARTLVGVAGTVTTLSAIEQRLDPYDGARVHGASLGRDRVLSLAEKLASMTTEERLGLVGLSPKRADVIVAGAWLVYEIMMWAKCEQLIASDRGVRWGLATRELRH